MSTIRWIAISDTHFGAENSLLSHVPDGEDRVDPTKPSAVLDALVRCLRAVVDRTNPDGRRPTLVLDGDILELALAHGNVAAMAFDRFLDLAFDARAPLFDDTILYLPGNHDHHLWETARERRYAAAVAAADPETPLDEPFHTTELLFDTTPRPEAELLTGLLQRRHRGLRVDVAYPNLAVGNSDLSRLVVFHHGHFVEPVYRLMSDLKAAVFPGGDIEDEAPDLERDNFAWIDFLWSTVGRSLAVGNDVGLVYLMSQDPVARDRLADNLGDHVGACLTSARWRTVARWAGRLAARWAARHLQLVERQCATAVLSAPSSRGLDSYLARPLLRQLHESAARPGDEQVEVRFVFGHTHKPFETVRSIDGYGNPVAIYNLGGWVVDRSPGNRLHGAAVSLVSDELEVASLRMFDLADLGTGAASAPRFAAHPAGAPGDAFRDTLAATVDLAGSPWTDFVAAATDAVVQREAFLPRIVERGLALSQRRR